MASSKPDFQKHKTVTGTFDSAFQLNIRRLRGSANSANVPVSAAPQADEKVQQLDDDTVGVALMDMFGYHCTPHIGVYGKEYGKLGVHRLVLSLFAELCHLAQSPSCR